MTELTVELLHSELTHLARRPHRVEMRLDATTRDRFARMEAKLDVLIRASAHTDMTKNQIELQSENDELQERVATLQGRVSELEDLRARLLLENRELRART